ncbi:MAG: hypothetical protein ACI9MC_004096 [Kiritimatiellia bacterium]|jgi:hypothetical protein
MRTTIVATLALLPVAASAANIDFFAEGAGSAELTGVVTVPLLRGVDTNGRAAVLAAGPEKDERDEYLLTINLSDGPNLCTEPVVGALGGWIKEMVVAKQSSLFGATIKTTVKGGFIPKLYIGDMVLKDVHCEIHAEVNSLSLAATDVIAAGILPSKGEVQFVAAAEAETLLSAVGNIQSATRVGPSVTWYHGRKVASTASRLEIEGAVFGAKGTVLLSPHEDTYVAATHERSSSWHRSGVLWTAGDASIGDVALQPAEYLVYDGDIGYPSEIAAVLGHDALYATDIAVDATSGRVAVAAAKSIEWTDVGKLMLDDAKKNFDKAGEDKEDGAETASLMGRGLGHVPAGVRLAVAGGDFAESERCATSAATDNGSFGFDAAQVGCDDVQPRVLRASEDGESSEGSADDDSAIDKKEAGRQRTYAGSLLKHGLLDEALAHAKLAAAANPNDCSLHLDVSSAAITTGDADLALTESKKAADLWDGWMALSLEDRLDVANGGGPEDAPAKQPDCHYAWASHAGALLTRRDWSKVDAIYAKHMDLSDLLAFNAVTARLADDRAAEAQGVAVQALNLGRRGRRGGHTQLGLIGARTDRVRLAEANLDRLFVIEGEFQLTEAIGGYAIALESGGDASTKAMVERLVTEHPYSASSWAMFGFDAKRRGDAAAMATFDKFGIAAAEAHVDRSASNADIVCESSAVYALAGEADAASKALAEGQKTSGTVACGAANMLGLAAAGDAQGLAKVYAELSQRSSDPVVVLELVKAVPVAAEPAPAPE